MAGRGRFSDLTGLQFGLWKVVKQEPSKKTRNGTMALWLCRCFCANEQVLNSTQLRLRRPASCGCERGAHRHTAQGKVSATYRSWQGMISRCTQPSNPGFKYYTKRGITVCARWRTFENFFADMGERPTDKPTLDRIDNDGNYKPGNCRWATRREQANNRMTNLVFEYKGSSYTLADLARFTGVSKEILRSRLCRSKLPWTVDGAISTPKLPKKQTRAGFYC